VSNLKLRRKLKAVLEITQETALMFLILRTDATLWRSYATTKPNDKDQSMTNLAHQNEYANGSYKVFTRADLKALYLEDPDKWSEICQAANQKRFRETFWKIYMAYRKLWQETKREPSIRDVASLSGCSKTSVHKHFKDLRFLIERKQHDNCTKRCTLEGGMGGGPEQKTENLEPVAKIYGDIERSRTRTTLGTDSKSSSKAFEGDTEQGFAAIRARNLEKVKVLELLMLQPSG
jgi:hypothetical protein